MKWLLQDRPIPHERIPLYNRFYLHASKASLVDPVLVWGTEIEAEPLQAVERHIVQNCAQPLDEERLVEPEAEHHALALPDVERERLELTLRPAPVCERGNVSGQPGRVAPAATFDCRNRADPDAEVVATEPVGQVVARTEVATVCAVGRPAEVRGLVPAVPG